MLSSRRNHMGTYISIFEKFCCILVQETFNSGNTDVTLTTYQVNSISIRQRKYVCTYIHQEWRHRCLDQKPRYSEPTSPVEVPNRRLSEGPDAVVRRDDHIAYDTVILVAPTFQALRRRFTCRCCFIFLTVSCNAILRGYG